MVWASKAKRVWSVACGFDGAGVSAAEVARGSRGANAAVVKVFLRKERREGMARNDECRISDDELMRGMTKAVRTVFPLRKV
jgi:hypothetical protein